MLERLKLLASSRGQFVAAVAVCAVLASSALATGWFINEALEERRIATAATNLQLAAQTVASADALLTAGVAISPPDLPQAVALLAGDHDDALHSLAPGERTEAERLLAEIANCGIMLLAPGGSDHEPHGHDELRVVLATATARAEQKAAAAERWAALSLLVAAVAAYVAGWLLMRSRIGELRLRRDLIRQANTDLLTGLPNRRALDPVLRGVRRQMEATGCAAGLIFLDLDGFKDINDTMGHDAGDQLLVQVAARLRDAQRTGDVLLRLGGDEFAVVLSGLADPAEAPRIAERYLEVLTAPFVVGARPEQLRTSIGVTTTSDPAGVRSLTTEADLAMYDAKRRGGNGVAVFSRSMEERSSETSGIVRALRAADYDREFAVVYQPIVTVDQTATLGYEALLRWTSPTLGPVGPGRFVPVAERAGEICAIGRWVLESVCRQLHAWDRAGEHRGCSVSWNVSARQLAEPGFVDEVLQTLGRWGLGPERLVVEVTESTVLDQSEAIERLAQLRRAGLRISIDDFGSGYSNLGQLLQVPFDVIKIDRSLLLTLSAMREAAGGDPSGPCAIMEAIVSIASVFHAPVVCEGVETDQQLRSLEASGVTHVQGYLVGRPVPPEQLPGGHYPVVVTSNEAVSDPSPAGLEPSLAVPRTVTLTR